MATLAWHEGEEYDDYETTAKRERLRYRVPTRERQAYFRREAVRAAVAIGTHTPDGARKALGEGEAPWEGISVSVPELKPSLGTGDVRQVLFALVLSSVLATAAGVLLGHGLKASLPMAANLELQLSGVLRQRSMRTVKGGAGQGFRFDSAARLARLTGGSVR